jgi:hypothetical protein
MLDFFMTFFLMGARFSTGCLAAIGRAAVVLGSGPSVAAAVSVRDAMPTGACGVELVLGSFAPPSADRLFVSVDRTNVRSATEDSIA